MTTFSVLVCLLGLLSITATDSGCTLDLGFVVDTTESITDENVPKLRKALSEIVQRFDVSEDGTHVSLETFANTSTIHSKFSDDDYYSNESVLKLINKSVSMLSKPTRLGHAIQMADEKMFTKENGNRPGVSSVMVLLTDGKSNPKTNVTRYMQDIKDIKHQNLVTRILAFVVDRTDSAGEGNFTLVKGFLVQVSNTLTIGPDATHTGFILFDRKPVVLNKFSDSEYYSNDKFQELIEEIPIRLGNRTFIDRALKKARYSQYTEMGGDRPDIPKWLVLITDGKTNPGSKPVGPIIKSLKLTK